MTFSRWIERQGGTIAAAKLLGVTPRAVRHWLKRRVTPRPAIMRKIVELSKGRVTYKAILDETRGGANGAA